MEPRLARPFLDGFFICVYIRRKDVIFIKKFYLLVLIASLGFSGCSNANGSIEANRYTKHEDHMVDDLEVVDFMDENFDMSKIEQHSCCDE